CRSYNRSPPQRHQARDLSKALHPGVCRHTAQHSRQRRSDEPRDPALRANRVCLNRSKTAVSHREPTFGAWIKYPHFRIISYFQDKYESDVADWAWARSHGANISSNGCHNFRNRTRRSHLRAAAFGKESRATIAYS